MQIKLICVVVLPFRISGITSLQENNVIATDWMFFSHLLCSRQLSKIDNEIPLQEFL